MVGSINGAADAYNTPPCDYDNERGYHQFGNMLGDDSNLALADNEAAAARREPGQMGIRGESCVFYPTDGRQKTTAIALFADEADEHHQINGGTLVPVICQPVDQGQGAWYGQLSPQGGAESLLACQAGFLTNNFSQDPDTMRDAVNRSVQTHQAKGGGSPSGSEGHAFMGVPAVNLTQPNMARQSDLWPTAGMDVPAANHTQSNMAGQSELWPIAGMDDPAVTTQPNMAGQSNLWPTAGMGDPAVNPPQPNMAGQSNLWPTASMGVPAVNHTQPMMSGQSDLWPTAGIDVPAANHTQSNMAGQSELWPTAGMGVPAANPTQLSMAGQSNSWGVTDNPETSVPLRRWVELEKCRSSSDPKLSVIRKLKVAYGIGKLLESSNPVQASFSVDNFIIREPLRTTNPGVEWKVVGVDMKSPSLSLQLFSTVMGKVQDGKDMIGRDVSAVFASNCPPVLETEANEMLKCCALGSLLHFIFSEGSVSEYAASMEDRDRCQLNTGATMVQPAKKQTRQTSFSQASISDQNANGNTSNGGRAGSTFLPLVEYGCCFSISQLVRDLLSCGDGLFRHDTSFKRLKDGIDEIHLLLKEPHFLFDCINVNGNHLLTFGPYNKLFGRSDETSKLMDAFNRVAFTGRSEVVMIAGYSGSGKTSLVRKAAVSDMITKGYYVERKFEELSAQSCLTVIFSAFDEMIIKIARSASNEQLATIHESLSNEFGTNSQFLVSILPNALLLLASNAIALPFQHNNGNLISICYTIQRFLTVISRCVGLLPGMIFLDDLQWADPSSMILIQAVLSSLEDAKSLLFVGSYRNNETNTCLYSSNFLGFLSQLNVPINTIHLEELPEKDVNLMISDSLHIVPRLCSPLATVVQRKTKGSPIFIRQFLRALVDRGLLTYSLRDKRWLWDIDKIIAEPITDNVLQLITSKMNVLSEDTQTALKVAACFGIKISHEIVKLLSETNQYMNLKQAIDKAVDNELMDSDGAYYHFAHDKVRESAFDLISTASRNQYHFEIGMALYTSCMNLQGGQSHDLLFTTIEQVNYGVPSLLTSPSQRIAISQLNYKAGLASMKRSNFIDVLTYMKAAHSLLPENSWEVQYSLSLDVYYQLAKAAHPCGEVDIAKSALKEIDQKARCFEDKLDAYDLLVRILQHQQEELSLAQSVCCNALKLLGENVPNESECSVTTQFLELMVTKMNSAFTSTNYMLNMPRVECNKTLDIMRFYHQLIVASYMKGSNEKGRGVLCGYYISKWLSFCLKKGVVCRLTPVALSCYSSMIVYEFREGYCKEANRLGNIALKLLNENEDQAELPATYALFYGYVGIMFQPIQACVESHKRGYEVGMQMGNTSDAFINLFFLIPRMIESGVNLGVIQKEIESYQRLAETHSTPVLATYMQWYQDTITLLCGESTSPATISPADPDQCKITDATAIHLVQLIIPALFLGQIERVQYLYKRWESLDDEQKNRLPWRNILVAFYYGLAQAEDYRRKNRKHFGGLDFPLSVLEKASKLSNWNAKNKLFLLAAEKLSLKGKSDQAEARYDMSIKAAKSSKFVHEEALACELAGKHHERKGEYQQAISFYKQAKDCYNAWGVERKASQMTEAIGRISQE